MEKKPKEHWGLRRMLETSDWLEKNVPSAVAWFVLWRADDIAKRHAVEMAQDLPPHRRHHLIHSRVDAERESSLGLLAELIVAEERLDLAVRHLRQTPGLAEYVQDQRSRISELVAELQIDAAPATTEPRP